ncbi:alpha-L-arabinofuranosidase C-terminal domain-containing protein [Mucilaginibacter auburnensis]|uniref:non-reducing end alpha-L-arabinofuranosidase n=1 Tax=Mucilaginibacter auburnensis TaxID=1457233 RepID=A0A2H9VRY1_9SPHI|nr:alpha-L-arabinofuranosidase C-terminal domain-containing protein [Mucilaginibacter auburnensis]PJJ83568.1 alpha-N-arabinofuranosidase [Mucilaginibacter auburnensis]
MKLRFLSAAVALTCAVHVAGAQTTKLTLDLSKATVPVSPMLYGLMTEEINYAYDGGLYAELIRNRIFKNNTKQPDGWSLISEGDAKAAIQLIGADPTNVPRNERGHAINEALTTCLRLTVEKPGTRAGIANSGYWGIPVKPGTTYDASFYIKGTGQAPPAQFGNRPPQANSNAAPIVTIADNTAGPITVSLESNDGKTVFASGTIDLIKSPYWKKYSLKLTTKTGFTATKDAHFVISTNRTGLYYFNLVSLFPPTYGNRPNGSRPDLMQMLVDMKPAFLRFPGGNYLEGPYLADHFPWKTTLGPLEQRPGHPGSWGYRATDGLGLLEFLGWCEDAHMEPLLGVYAGYSLNGDHVDPGPLLEPYVQDALEEIEYIIGDAKTTYWGKRRAADGHPAPFKLTYVEVGNEDWFDRSNTYDGRFNQFRAAINKKYPQLKVISTIASKVYPTQKVTSGPPIDMEDEHYYQNSWQMQEDAFKYDNYDRKKGPKIFVGEWATREGSPTTNLISALGDAAFMTGMERNSDVVLMSCFAPLFVNVNPKNDATGEPSGMQWASDLIGYDALNSYGSPSYYVQSMFNNNIGNRVVPVSATNLPMLHIDTATLNKNLSPQQRRGRQQKPERPSLYYVATKDTKTGTIYIKVVNVADHAENVTLDLNGAGTIVSTGTLIELKGDKPEATNTITDPKHIVPITTNLTGIGKSFAHSFSPYSVSVIKIKTTPAK